MPSKCHIHPSSLEKCSLSLLLKLILASSFFNHFFNSVFIHLCALNIYVSYSCSLFICPTLSSFLLFLCSFCGCGQMDAHLHSSLFLPGNEHFCLASVSVHLYGFFLSDNKELLQHKHFERYITVITKRGCKGKKKGR